MTSRVQRHFDDIALDYDRWKQKSHYYYDALKRAAQEVVPSGKRVLEVGCGTGDVLSDLSAADGLGIDISPRMVALASQKHPDVRFSVHDITLGPMDERFDYVLAVDILEHVPDLDGAMKAMGSMLDDQGRLVVITANPMWRLVLEAAEHLRLKMPEGEHRWRSKEELIGAAARAGLDAESFGRMLLIPKSIPGLRALNTARWAERLRQRLGLIQRAVFVAPRTALDRDLPVRTASSERPAR